SHWAKPSARNWRNIRDQRAVQNHLERGAMAHHHRPGIARSRAGLLLRAEYQERRKRKAMGVAYSRRALRCRPLADYLVRASLLSFTVRQLQRDLRRARGCDGSDVVALPDRSGAPGRV